MSCTHIYTYTYSLYIYIYNIQDQAVFYCVGSEIFEGVSKSSKCITKGLGGGT